MCVAHHRGRSRCWRTGNGREDAYPSGNELVQYSSEIGRELSGCQPFSAGFGVMTREQKHELERLLQETADALWSGLPDRMRVSIEEGGIRCIYVGWSPPLVRHEIRDDIDLDDARKPYGCHARWRDIVLPVMQTFIGDHVAEQRKLHARAETLGLVVDNRCHDLPVDRWLIDASLLRLVNASGINVLTAASAIVAMSWYDLSCGDGDTIWENVGDHTFCVELNKDGVPVISTPLDVGRGLYEDRSLEFPDLLPDALMDAASGRRLGEIVATGFDHLDARRVETIIRFKPPKGGWRDCSRTQIRLEPEYVPLGHAAARSGVEA
jgi:hypothetical protein